MNFFFSLLAVLMLPIFAAGSENYSYFARLPNLMGMTGSIYTPTAVTLEKNKYSFSLHQFNIGLVLGLGEYAEVGTNFDVKKLTSLTGDLLKDWEIKQQEISLLGKYRFYAFGGNDHGDLALAQYRDVTYLVGSKYFKDFYSLTFSGGLLGQLWKRQSPAIFFSLAQTQSMQQFLLDYDGLQRRWSFGCRFLLSPDVCLDLFMTDITHYQQLFTNFIFGIIMVS